MFYPYKGQKLGTIMSGLHKSLLEACRVKGA
jgi:hypothetical protein